MTEKMLKDMVEHLLYTFEVNFKIEPKFQMNVFLLLFFWKSFFLDWWFFKKNLQLVVISFLFN